MSIQRWLALGMIALPTLWSIPETARPQAPARIAWALVGTEASSRANVNAFRAGLRELGYVEGASYVLDLRYADGHVERHPQLIRDLIQRRPDVILGSAYQGTLAARNATATIPIVGISCGIELLVDTLARPTGNVTGVTCQSPELGPKQVQLFLEALPQAKRIAILYNPEAPYTEPEVREVQRVLASRGIRFFEFPMTRPTQLQSVVTQIRNASADGVFVIPDNMVYGNRMELAHLMLSNRLPMMSGYSDFVVAGGLMSYGSNLPALIRRASWYVNRILKGRRPSELAVEQPTHFELVINVETAKALGMTIPPALLSRVDRRIPEEPAK